MKNVILTGDVREQLALLEDESVHTCVTSPPYWGLRDYGTATWLGGDEGCDHRHQGGGEGVASAKQNTSAGTQTVAYRDTCGKCGATRVDSQLGLEPTPEAYVESMVSVFREVRRVLRKDGTLWLNLGDSYAADGRGTGGNRVETSPKQRTSAGSYFRDAVRPQHGLKPKDLVGIPWRVAFALQADGWWLRSDIIWSKPNPMPESVTDRPTKAHEYIFLLSKSQTYYYDHEAIKEGPSRAWWDEPRTTPANPDRRDGGSVLSRPRKTDKQRGHSRRHAGFNDRWDGMTHAEQASMGRNKRTVWEVATHPFPEAHFATYPPELIKPCILAGSPEGGVVLDPFFGSGTTGVVALTAARDFIGIELNPAYVAIAEARLEPLLMQGRLV